MQSLNKQSETGRPKADDVLERLYLWNIAKGMWITMKHIFKRKATISYPEQKRDFSPVFRGLQVLNRDEGAVKSAPPAAFVPWPALRKLLPWKPPNGNPEKNIFTGRKICGKIRDQHAALHILRAL